MNSKTNSHKLLTLLDQHNKNLIIQTSPFYSSYNYYNDSLNSFNNQKPLQNNLFYSSYDYDHLTFFNSHFLLNLTTPKSLKNIPVHNFSNQNEILNLKSKLSFKN